MSGVKPLKIVDGWLDAARQVCSPNCDQRPANCSVSLLVIHNISLPPGEFGGSAIEEFFCNELDCSSHPFYREIASLKVSSHLLITREGELIQFVSLNERAWHAGVSSFQGQSDCNDFSIGIELEGTDEAPYTEYQYQVLGDVTRVLLASYPELNLQRITGHSDIAPDRKTDPGPCFNWDRYRELAASVGERK